jgi:CheY-like chemotaxis protein
MREIRAWESSHYTNTNTNTTSSSTNTYSNTNTSRQRTAILGMSGHSLPIDIEAAKHAGMNAFMLKPLHPDTLVELIAMLVNDSASGSTASYQSLQSTMHTNSSSIGTSSSSSTSLSPRKLRATTLVSTTRVPLGNSSGTVIGSSSNNGSNSNAMTSDFSGSTSAYDSSNSIMADECALLKRQVALAQGRKTVAAPVTARHNTLL